MGNKKLRNQERKKKDHRTKKRRTHNKKNITVNDENIAVNEENIADKDENFNVNDENIAVVNDESIADKDENAYSIVDINIENEETTTASERKIKSAENRYAIDNDVEEDFAYVFMDTNILISIFRELIKYCPNCRSNVIINFDIKKKMGFAHYFTITCSNSCSWDKSFYTSKLAAKRGRTFDVNVRSIMAFREIGKGFTDMETFSGFMNIPPPMSNYNSIIRDTILPTYLETVEQDMKDASLELQLLSSGNDLDDGRSIDVGVDETHEEEDDEEFSDFEDDDTDETSEVELEHQIADDDGVCDVTASFDGTWQRRGYASLNGVVTCISIDSGKCLAYECLTKKCRSCEAWEERKGTEEYEHFKENHDCPINHTGSAASMETAGVMNIYSKSVSDLNIRYMKYIGDGDSKAYPTVQREQPYGPNKIPVKGECIGHVQKRVGTRLRNLKKSLGKEKLKDGKTIGGRNRLTKNAINRLQNYYGLAIRQNVGNLHSMRKAVGAVLYHCSEASTVEARHQFCDKDSNWCRYRIAQRNNVDYAEKKGLPIVIRDKIMPIFQDLSKPELLSKCLHGHTQNNNEGLNQLIWKRLPKSIYVGAHVLKLGVASAVLRFNNGCSPMMFMLKKLGLFVGTYTRKFCEAKDKFRIENLKRKMSVEGKLYRKKKRAERKGFEDREQDDEGDMYACGEF